jgi:hypothetical protein
MSWMLILIGIRSTSQGYSVMYKLHIMVSRFPSHSKIYALSRRRMKERVSRGERERVGSSLKRAFTGSSTQCERRRGQNIGSQMHYRKHLPFLRHLFCSSSHLKPGFE